MDSRAGGTLNEKATKKEIKGEGKTAGVVCEGREIAGDKSGRRISHSECPEANRTNNIHAGTRTAHVGLPQIVASSCVGCRCRYFSADITKPPAVAERGGF
jgi:hypothetical protein